MGVPDEPEPDDEPLELEEPLDPDEPLSEEPLVSVVVALVALVGSDVAGFASGFFALL